MRRQQLAHLGRDDIVAAAAVGEHAQRVVQLRRAIHAHGHANAIDRKELNDRRSKQRGVGSEAEIDRPAERRSLMVGVLHHPLEQRKIHQRLAAEERNVHAAPLAGFGKQHVDCGAGGVEIHELRLALGRRDFVRAVLVAVPAGEVALIRQVQHQRLQRENRRRILRRLGRRIARDDGAALRQFAKQADCILTVQAERSEPFHQFLERELTRGQMVQHRCGGDRPTRRSLRRARYKQSVCRPRRIRETHPGGRFW